MIQKIKEDLFTPSSIVIAIIYGLIVSGAVSAWLFWNVQVMGNDIAMSVPSKTSMSRYLGK